MPAGSGSWPGTRDPLLARKWKTACDQGQGRIFSLVRESLPLSPGSKRKYVKAHCRNLAGFSLLELSTPELIPGLSVMIVMIAGFSLLALSDSGALFYPRMHSMPGDLFTAS